MSAAKKTPPISVVPPWVGRTFAFLIGPGRTLTLAAIIVAAFAGGAYAVWRRVERHVINSPEYLVTVDQISITPPPEWVRSDLRAEAFRSASSPDRPLSSLDDNLAERMHIAFTLNPWVAKAMVTKRAGGRLLVDIEYRRPACMVEVVAGQIVELLPVDGQGVWLPGEDFSQRQKESYPCLSGIDRRPIQPVGHAWGDARVVDGAAIAAALGPCWQQLKLYRILYVPPRSAADRPTFELYTRAGTKIVWGSAGGLTAGEPNIEEKVGRLQQFVAEHGSLDGGPVLDVRTLPPVKVAK